MDIATIIGFIAAFGLIVAGILQGGSLMTFVDPPSLLIVVGGTIGATLVNYSLSQVLGLIGIIKNAFFSQSNSPQDWIKHWSNSRVNHGGTGFFHWNPRWGM